MNENLKKRATAVLCCVGLMTSYGCERAYRSAPVKPDVARETLKLTLEEWQKGATPESMRKRSPEIVVQDMEWTSGAKLMAFELVGDGEPVDANLVAKVKLTLQSPKGQKAEKTVTYVVGTSPVLTVFRDLTR